MSKSADPLRDQLIQLLRGGNAHLTFDEAVANFPVSRAGIRPARSPHSGWELLEHMRIAQNDILRFSQSADHVSPKFPDGYWPAAPEPPDSNAWTRSVKAYREDLAEFEAMVLDAARDLNHPFPWGDGQTLLRETLLIADHNAYHLGQLVLVGRLVE